MTLQEWQDAVDEWIKTVGVRYFDEMTNMVVLMEEVGEFSRHMSRTYGEQSYKTKEESLTAKSAIKEELADIFFVLTCLANQMNISLEEVLKMTMDKKTGRDQDRHRNNPKLQ
jgi:NTP pyrophosphatase (non-canonical NTP hydrolase)